MNNNFFKFRNTYKISGYCPHNHDFQYVTGKLAIPSDMTILSVWVLIKIYMIRTLNYCLFFQLF
jgi:hypothetical protein